MPQVHSPDGRSWTVRRHWVPRLGDESLWRRFRRRFRQTVEWTRELAPDTLDFLDDSIVIGIALILLALLVIFVGLPVLLSPEPISVHRAFVQIPGRAHRLRATALREMAEALPTLRDRCLRYVQVMLMQNSQIAACNARHELPGRLARWLLMSRDRIDGDDLPMTQEFLSFMLGVRRAGISVVANSLQAQGLIRQSRGRITILDRAGLQEKACTCYRMIEHNRARIMGVPRAAGAPTGLDQEQETQPPP